MRRSTAGANGNSVATPPKNKPPWNSHQPRTPNGRTIASSPSTPRAATNKENILDDSLPSISVSSSYNAATAASSATLPNQNHKLAPSSAGPVKSACLSAKAGAARRSGPGLGGGMTQQPVTPTNQEFEVTTCSGLLKEVLASAASASTSSQKRGQQPQPAASPDPLVAIRQLACQLAGKVAHRPDCVSLLSQLDSHIDQLAADIDTVASQLRDENRALRRRVRQLEGKLKTASSSGQSESMAASAASQSEAARREWGRREAQLLARLQAAEAARGSLESRTVALEKELKEMTRLSRPISVVSNGASNAPASASAAAATPPVPTPTSALLTAENLARHAALVANSPSSAFNYGEEDDYAISSVSQQQQRHQQPRININNNNNYNCRDYQAVLPPPAATSSPPTLDTAPASAPAPTQPAGLRDADDDDDDEESLDSNLGDSDADEAEFRRGLARIEEQIARLQSSLGASNGKCANS
ncbi:hypothetical protein BOX15_Mlig000857g4 [Macrostomum lignano]|uniref:Uncharacterized protein n=2 Tax=Macrostomum lignano TaxID=282301 RepID=A0A267GEF2_9PLAT|nr:hypothetical protein BOX15_Mlig000857g4 [Macrostomum lignano]